MAITPEQQQAVIDALSDKQKGPITCPITKESHWTIQGYIAALVASNDAAWGAEDPEVRSFPAAVVMCETCGYMIFVNLFLLGLGDNFGMNRVE